MVLFKRKRTSNLLDEISKSEERKSQVSAAFAGKLKPKSNGKRRLKAVARFTGRGIKGAGKVVFRTASGVALQSNVVRTRSTGVVVRRRVSRPVRRRRKRARPRAVPVRRRRRRLSQEERREPERRDDAFDFQGF